MRWVVRHARVVVDANVEPLDPRVRHGAYDHHRAQRLAYDAFRDRAEDQPLEAGQAMRSDEHEIRTDLAAQREDLVGGLADPRVDEELGATAFGVRCEAQQDVIGDEPLDLLGVLVIDVLGREHRQAVARVDRDDHVQHVLRGPTRDLEGSV
jgi:hypothetical protein